MKSFTNSEKLMALLFILGLLIACIVVGCANPITREDSTESQMTTFESPDLPDELWIISSLQGLRSNVTIDDVIKLIENNLTSLTVDGFINVELLKALLEAHFGKVEIITDSTHISTILSTVDIKASVDPDTGNIRITIIVS